MGSSVNVKDINSDTTNHWAEIGPDEKSGHEKKKQRNKSSSKKKDSLTKRILRFAIYLIIIAVLIYAVLYVIAFAAHYPSITAMLNHMFGELQLMGERVAR